MKQALIQTAQEALEQKTALAMYGSGTLAAITSFAEGITPLLPLLSFIVMVVFGVINYRLNRKVKLGKRHGNK